MLVSVFGFPYQFQSTLSVRRATFLSMVFNIRNYISIHALREESDSTDGTNKYR